MPPLKPGWRCYMAPSATDKYATDISPAFDTREELMVWLRDSGVEYRPNEQVYARAIGVEYFGELTGDVADQPWATACHSIVGA